MYQRNRHKHTYTIIISIRALTHSRTTHSHIMQGARAHERTHAQWDGVQWNTACASIPHGDFHCKTAQGKSMYEYVCFHIVLYFIWFTWTVAGTSCVFSFRILSHFTLHLKHQTVGVLAVRSENIHSVGKTFFVLCPLCCVYVAFDFTHLPSWMFPSKFHVHVFSAQNTPSVDPKRKSNLERWNSGGNTKTP